VLVVPNSAVKREEAERVVYVLDGGRVALDGLVDRGAWRYATVGHGHGAEWWSGFVAALEGAGYAGVISVEHEDEQVAPELGIAESARALERAIAGAAA